MKTDLKIAYVYIIIFSLLFCISYIASSAGWQEFDFSYINCLVPDRGDQSQHQLGWEAYRNSPWYFPLGFMDQLSYPTKVSVTFTDSLPLFAVFFKALSPVLPESFQYFTLWFLLCFILQCLCAAGILRKHTDSKFALIAASLFFAAAPVMLKRIHLHNALAGQWIILFMLDPLFNCKKYLKGPGLYCRTAAAGLLASLIHPYFDIFCGFIVLTLCALIVFYTKSVKRSAAVLMLYLFSAIIPHFLLGGIDPRMTLIVGSGGNVLDSSMNLNALFNSMGFSKYVRALPLYANTQTDGFAYLGLGGFLLTLSAAAVLALRYSSLKDTFKRNLPTAAALIILSAFTLLLAASPQVTFGRHMLFQYTLPEPVMALWGFCKSTARCVWIFIYILLLSSFILLFRGIAKKWLLNGLAAIILTVQICELPNFFLNNFTYKLEPRKTYLSDEYLWEKIAADKKIKHIIFTLPFSYSADNILYSIADIALSSHKTLNCFFFARELKQEIYLQNISEALENLSEENLYVFFEENKEDCLRLGLNYYFTGQFIVGCRTPLAGCPPLTQKELREIIKDGNLPLVTAQYQPAE
ncbi:hypothetical protein IJT93_02465 [bacterium]|nr:hypothetical protein [bacterium]